MNAQIELTALEVAKYAGINFPVDEATVRICMAPFHEPDFNHEIVQYDDEGAPRQWSADDTGTCVRVDSEADASVHVMLRTAAVFCIDGADEALQSVIDGATPDLPELPPLPFPRIWIEGRDGDKPCPLISWDYDDFLSEHEVRGELVAFCLNELQRCERWHVIAIFGFGDIYEAAHWIVTAAEDGVSGDGKYGGRTDVYEFLAGEQYDPDAPADSPQVFDLHQSADRKLIELILTAAHFIVADSVPHSEPRFPRAQRRDAKRRYLTLPPHLYIVNLRESGSHDEGDGTRQYHVRWLVRGHWRRSRYGDTFVRAKRGMCVWVKPHIKGPPRAPWKGRAVHTVGRE